MLFFGNADDLSHAIRDRHTRCDSIVLDLKGVSDIDASGANILAGIAERSRAAGKRLLFCNVPEEHREMIDGLAAGAGECAVLPDLDSALEWMEERTLLAQAGKRGTPREIDIWEHPLLHGFDEADRDAFAPHLVRANFAPGGILCAEGEPADRMWLLTKGSVSVRVQVPGPAGSVRLASCAVGTSVGEMALLELGARSASVVADDHVEAYELSRQSFETLSRLRPQAAAKAWRSMSIGLGLRLRGLSEDFKR